MKASLIQPASAIAEISPRPVFIIHGAGDELIGVENGHELFGAAREPKELWIIPECLHAQGIFADRDEYVRRVVAFLDRALGIRREVA